MTASPIVVMAIRLAALLGPCQIPDGFEVVELIPETSEQHGLPRLNNCGEIVFHVGRREASRIFYWNEKSRQLTEPDGVITPATKH